MKRCIFACLAVGLLALATACSTKKDTSAQPPPDDTYVGDTSSAPPADQVDQDILADDYGAGAGATATGADNLPPEATRPAAPAFTPVPGSRAGTLAGTQGGYVSPLPPISEGYPDYTGSARTSSGSRGAPGGTYVVKRGDSLWSISRRHGTTVNALASANNISPTGVLRVGQRLTIPGGAAALSSGTGTTSTGSGRTYRVQPGDSYYKIARKFNVSTKKLMDYNGATSPTLRVGQTVRIP